MPGTRVLFVDDDPAIRQTLPTILRRHGFEVSVASTVYEAIAAISTYSFDVLLSDLNVGEPGDGFTIVSAMRRTQPNAVTIILTGYPAFETALRAIRNQVDDYIVKPSTDDVIVSTIRERLTARRPSEQVAPQRAAEVLKRCENDIIDEWLGLVEHDPELGRIRLDRAQRIDHIKDMLHSSLDAALPGNAENEADMRPAALHGEARRNQGYSAQLVLREARLLRRVIGTRIQCNLISIDVSSLVPDMLEIADVLDEQITESLRAFGQESRLSALPRMDNSQVARPNNEGKSQ